MVVSCSRLLANCWRRCQAEAIDNTMTNKYEKGGKDAKKSKHAQEDTWRADPAHPAESSDDSASERSRSLSDRLRRNKGEPQETVPGSDLEVSAHDADGAGMQDEDEMSQQETHIMAMWEAKAEAHISACMQAKVPELVKSTMMGFMKPLQSDVLALRTQQKKLEQGMHQLQKEVNASRITGQAMQDKVSTMEQNLAKLARSFEDFTMRHVSETIERNTASAQAQPGSSVDGARHAGAYIGTPRQGAESAKQEEELRTKLIRPGGLSCGTGCARPESSAGGRARRRTR